MITKALPAHTHTKKDQNLSNLNDPDLVGHVERIVVRGQPDVGLLRAVGPHEGVDLGDGDVVERGDGGLDLLLVRARVDDEHERVVVLDLLHGRLGRERELDHVELVEARGAERDLARELGLAGALERLGAVEDDGRADLAAALVGVLLDGLGGLGGGGLGVVFGCVVWEGGWGGGWRGRERRRRR